MSYFDDDNNYFGIFDLVNDPTDTPRTRLALLARQLFTAQYARIID